MNQKLDRAWQVFLTKINAIKTAQNKIMKSFLEEISKRKAERIRQRLRK